MCGDHTCLVLLQSLADDLEKYGKDLRALEAIKRKVAKHLDKSEVLIGNLEYFLDNFYQCKETNANIDEVLKNEEYSQHSIDCEKLCDKIENMVRPKKFIKELLEKGVFENAQKAKDFIEKQSIVMNEICFFTTRLTSYSAELGFEPITVSFPSSTFAARSTM